MGEKFYLNVYFRFSYIGFSELFCDVFYGDCVVDMFYIV